MHATHTKQIPQAGTSLGLGMPRVYVCHSEAGAFQKRGRRLLLLCLEKPP